MAIRTALFLELTNGCNFQCSFCRSVRLHTNDRLDFDTAIKCMDEAKDQTVYGAYMNSIQFNGDGEALLYPRLDEIIIEARKRFPFAEFVTNGSLLTEKRIETLLNTDIDMIEISLTGIIPEVYQYFQGSGIPYEQCEKQLKTVISNVHHLIKRRDELGKHTYIRLRYVTSRKYGSYQHLKDYVKYWKNSGVDEVFTTQLWDFKRKPVKDLQKTKVTRCKCKNTLMKVNANGTVFSCVNNHAIRNSQGNVYETPLSEIMTSESFISDKANKMTCDINRVPKGCLACEFRAYPDFWEEFRNMRRRYIFKKPVKNFLNRFLGIGYMCYERFERNGIVHRLFWCHICRQSKKVHDEFQLYQRRIEGKL